MSIAVPGLSTAAQPGRRHIPCAAHASSRITSHDKQSRSTHRQRSAGDRYDPAQLSRYDPPALSHLTRLAGRLSSALYTNGRPPALPSRGWPSHQSSPVSNAEPEPESTHCQASFPPTTYTAVQSTNPSHHVSTAEWAASERAESLNQPHQSHHTSSNHHQPTKCP